MPFVALLGLVLLAQPIEWSVDDRRTLVWGGHPYVPVGARIKGDPAEILVANQAGVKDVIVELPANGSGWAEAFATLEQAGMRYIVAIGSLAPMSQGFAVEPQSYRVAKLDPVRDFSVPLPGARFALAVVASARDGAVVNVQRVQPENDRLVFTARAAAFDSSLYLFPNTISLSLPSYWEGLDAHRDELLRSLASIKPGPGFRGLLNPMGRLMGMGSAAGPFVPDSDLFRLEFARYLEQKYRSPQTCMRAWSMSSAEITGFRHLARMVPLWRNQKGPRVFWDTGTDKTVPCEPRNSAFWSDVEQVVAEAETRRYARLVQAVQSVARVPVLQEWAGYASAYELKGSSLTGLGVAAGGDSPLALAQSAGAAVGTAFRWNGPCWIVGSNLTLPKRGDGALSVGDYVQELGSMGMRGWFFRTTDPKALAEIAQEANARALGGIESVQPKPLFYPLNAANPAHTMRLPNGWWWLPAPASGNRLDFGSSVQGYRYSEPGRSFTALWSAGESRRLRLRMANTKGVQVQAVDGSEPNPRIVKGGLEVTLTNAPLLVLGTEEVPVPDSAVEETVKAFDAFLALAERTRADMTEERFFFKDGVNAMERNPFGGYEVLRTQLQRASRRLSGYVWLEAENLRSTNFSEVRAEPSASARSALVLVSPLALDVDNFYVESGLNLAPSGELEVWVAARIEPKARKLVRFRVNDQTLRIVGDPVSEYGAGFAWYRFGETRLKDSQNTVRLEVEPAEGLDLAVDLIALVRPGFRPNATQPPLGPVG
ncbi:MAG: hypothetical protein KIS66_17785 [Fimbriimonadaceae bacterium]|nr:hypothetical protein [Fimbriimonadaceae bacterium]